MKQMVPAGRLGSVDPAYTRLAMKQLAPQIAISGSAKACHSKAEILLIQRCRPAAVWMAVPGRCGSTDDANTLAQVASARLVISSNQAKQTEIKTCRNAWSS